MQFLKGYSEELNRASHVSKGRLLAALITCEKIAAARGVQIRGDE